MDLGVYVHFPWCRQRCPYCDFAIAVDPLESIPHERYRDAALAELAARAGRYPGRRLASIYFGGGTPALWRPDCVAALVSAVRATFASTGELEITVEANPNDCAPEALARLRAAGVNRLSIGTQAFDDPSLVFLGRDHDASAARAAVGLARDAGFASISLDLIYALPGRTDAGWRRTLEDAVALSPDHVSVYELTIEERTTFGERRRRGELAPLSDERAATQFEAAHEILGAAGYEHYEVSAYARPGHRSRHNSLYWVGADVLGLGNGAHSLCRRAGGGAVRWASHRSVRRYLDGAPVGPEAPLEQDPLVADVQCMDAGELAEDLRWLGMRTRDGVPEGWLADRPDPVARLVQAGLVERAAGPDGPRVRPTPRGLLLADEIARVLLQ